MASGCAAMVAGRAAPSCKFVPQCEQKFEV